jgi:PKD repeat protein
MKFLLRFIVFLVLNSFACTYSIGQNKANDTANVPIWIKMMKDPNANFYQTQRAFNLYWEHREITPGCGYKPFKRWEYSVRNFVNAKGFIEPYEVQTNHYFDWKQNYNAKYFKKGIDPCPNAFWKEIGPNESADIGNLGRINAIAFHPTDSNIMYCGAPAGGLWKTIDKGKYWFPLTDSLATLGISAIIVDPKNPNIIYIGTGDRDARDAADKGVYKSVDGGKTFSIMNNGLGDKLIVKMIMDPYNSSVLIAATNKGAYRTTDGGKNWKMCVGVYDIMDLENKPGDFKTVYASYDGEFYLSQDSGKNFTKVNLNMPNAFSKRGAIGVSPQNPNIVYTVVTNSLSLLGFYMSVDAGKTFVLKSNSPNILGRNYLGSSNDGQAFYDLDIAVNPFNSAEVFVGGINIFRSLDSGKTWKIDAHTDGLGSSSIIHADQHVMEYSPVTKNLYSGSDGGCYERKRNGKWYCCSNGLGIGQVYRISVSNTRNSVINGYQDNGTKHFSGKGAFDTIGDGDGMDNLIDKANISHAYISAQNGSIYRRGFGDQSIIASYRITDAGGWVTPFILKENEHSTMIAGYRNIWISKNIDTTKAADIIWSQKTFYSGFPPPFIHKIENSPVNNKFLFFSCDDGKLFKTTNLSDAYPTFNDITSTLPTKGIVEAIECDYENLSIVYIAQNNKVYQSTNTGGKWNDISSGLPNVNVYCLVLDSSKKDGSIYAGTYTGVYYKNNSMSQWIPFNTNLPEAVWVRDIEISYIEKPSSYRLFAATYGRGTWESPLYNYGDNKPVAAFSPQSSAICTGQTIQMFDETDYLEGLTWEILDTSGAEFSDYTNSKSINPKIKFTKAGYYYIKLLVSNCNGKDSILHRIAVYDEMVNATCNLTASKASFGIFEGIKTVSFHKLFNSSLDTYRGGANEDFTCLNLQELNMDSTYSIDVETYSTNGEFCKGYIDFNNNGSFNDQGEEILSSKKGKLHHQIFGIPKTAATNIKLRLRVVSFRDSVTGPCMQTTYGQSEDYSIIIRKDYDFNAENLTVCTNNTVVFHDKSIEKSLKYQWDFGSDATPSTANTIGPHNVIYSKQGKKTIVLTINGSIVVKKVDYLNVVSPVKSKFTYQKMSELVYSFTPDNLNHNSYLWDFGDGIGNSKSKTPTYTYLTNGQYSVKLVTGITQCLDSSIQLIKASNLNVKTLNALPNKMSIIPNPNNGIFIVQLNLGKPESLSLELNDNLGRQVYSKANLIYNVGENIELNLLHVKLHPGIYTLNVLGSNGNCIFKLVLK